MKKRILSFILVMCLIVPCVMMLTACHEHSMTSIGFVYDEQESVVYQHPKCEHCDHGDLSLKEATEYIAVSTSEELKNALGTNQTLVLFEDITISNEIDGNGKAKNLYAINGKNIVLYLNGHNITATAAPTANNNYSVFDVAGSGSLEVYGKGTISLTHTGTDMQWNALSAVIQARTGAVKINKGVSVIHNGGTAMAYAVDVNTTSGTATLDFNGDLLKSSYVVVRIFNNHATAAGVVTINGGDVVSGSGSKTCVWVHYPNSNPHPAAQITLNSGRYLGTDGSVGRVSCNVADNVTVAEGVEVTRFNNDEE